MDADLPPLQQFILPGGSDAAARLHLARAICRRAERAVTTAHRAHGEVLEILVYLNRLADWLFVMSRRANQIAGVPDVPWEKQG
jgi:cob(I)alamin adenosyltransferase